MSKDTNENRARTFLPNAAIYPLQYYSVWLDHKTHVLFARINGRWIIKEPVVDGTEKDARKVLADSVVTKADIIIGSKGFRFERKNDKLLLRKEFSADVYV